VLVHADLYRVPPGASIDDLGLEERGGAILAVEWPRAPLAQARAWRVTIALAEDGSRRIDIAAPGNPGVSP
jgi:tRNA A37 threonylcarbamoyladenosine biosynthesis protein TsaE